MKWVCWKKGYTLTEMIAVLAVLAVVLAIAVPRIGSLSRWQLEIAARELAGNLRLAQQEAITGGQKTGIVFYLYANRYRVDLSQERKWVELPASVRYAGRTTFPNNPPSVSFNLLGTPTSGGTVIFSSDQEEKIYVIMTPVTGRVRVSRKPPESWQ